MQKLHDPDLQSPRNNAVLQIVTAIIIAFYYTQGEFNPLARKPFLQFAEGRELLKIATSLKSQLLNVNDRLALIREASLGPRA